MSRKFIIFIISMIVFSCSVKTVSKYHILEYVPDPDSLSRFNLSSLPIDAKVEVQNFSMNRVYDRNSLVVRLSLHELSFDDKQKWALRPDRAIPELIVNHINTAGIFKECKTDYFSVVPDYYISGAINNIEIYRNENILFAHIKMVMELRDRNRNILVSHSIDKKEDISEYNASYFVKAVSDILKSETHEFLLEIVDHFTKSGGSK